MANYATIPHAAVDGSTPLAQDSKATPWRRLVASAVVVSFALGAIGAVAGAPLTPDALVPDSITIRESCETRPRPRRGAPRGARRGARRGDAAEVEPRGGAHQPEARGGAILPVLRSTFLFLADTPSPRHTDSAGRHATAAFNN